MINFNNLLKLLGAFLEKALDKIALPTITSYSDVLCEVFGEPMSTTCITVEEVRKWIEARKSKLKSGAKAAVVKVNKNTFKELENYSADDYNYLVIFIVDERKKGSGITDFILIKYEQIDPALDNLLANGDGVLVVEG